MIIFHGYSNVGSIHNYPYDEEYITKYYNMAAQEVSVFRYKNSTDSTSTTLDAYYDSNGKIKFDVIEKEHWNFNKKTFTAEMIQFTIGFAIIYLITLIVFAIKKRRNFKRKEKQIE